MLKVNKHGEIVDVNREVITSSDPCIRKLTSLVVSERKKLNRLKNMTRTNVAFNVRQPICAMWSLDNWDFRDFGMCKSFAHLTPRTDGMVDPRKLGAWNCMER